MEERTPDLRTFLNILAVILLVLGLAGAVFVYQTAGNNERNSSNAIGYENGDGGTYPIQPEDSKSYERGMELYGGKANVLADQLRRWLIGLWQGQTLAYTIACITIFVSLVILGTANYLLPLEDGDAHDRDEGG